jgi:hypothetical protein
MGQFDPFAKPSANVCYLRIAVFIALSSHGIDPKKGSPGASTRVGLTLMLPLASTSGPAKGTSRAAAGPPQVHREGARCGEDPAIFWVTQV